MNWPKNLKTGIFKEVKAEFKTQEPLKKYTTFKIGGPAEFFIEPADTNDLKLLILSAKRYNIPILVLGSGSNTLVSDKGVRALVLKLNSPYFRSVTKKGNYLKVGSGLILRDLILKARDYGLSGLEFLTGIPATVGGALVMNAGAWGKNIGSVVKEVTVMDYQGKTRILSKKKIKFGYRKSSLTKYIVLNSTLRLARKNRKTIQEKMNKILKNRISTQDNTSPNAGCIFKNPPCESAGRLIDSCGLKGKRIGDACVSCRHANFILNRGRASASDVLKLMHLIQKKVKDKFRVTLEPEIKIWQ